MNPKQKGSVRVQPFTYDSFDASTPSEFSVMGLGSPNHLSHRIAQRIEKPRGALPKLPLFGQNADRKACKYDQEHNGSGGGKLVVTPLHKDSKHQDHAQDRQQNEYPD